MACLTQLSAERSPYGQLFGQTTASEGRDSMSEATQPITLARLSDQQRNEAMARFTVLQPHLEGNVPLSRAAREAGVALRTARRWLRRYRADGLPGLARPVRRDAGTRKLPANLAALIEGLALRKPRPSVAAIHREITKIVKKHRRRAVLCDRPRHCSRP
jgi:putative transposase